MRVSIFAALAASISTIALGASAAEVTKIKAPQPELSKAAFSNGKVLDLTVGYGSGAFAMPGGDGSVIYTITDRGPNIACDEAKDVVGLDEKALCAGEKDGKVFPAPDFDPTIFKVSLSGDAATIVESFPLKGRDGKRLTGISNPLTKNPTERAFDVNGKEIPQSANGFDSESLVRLKDGSFWISDEYSPSISHVGADGTVMERLVPAGVEGDYKSADYDVSGALPAIIMSRALNRGIESIAISPDEAYLYFALQSPLANPDKKAYKDSRILRLFKFDIAKKSVVGEYAYQIDLPESFKADNAKKPAKQNDVKVSEMVATGQDKLLVLERVSKTTKLYAVDLSKAKPLPAKFDDVATSPSLEQLTDDKLAAANVHPLEKTLAFDSDDFKDLPSKIEGVALIDPKTLVMVTDNDFAIAGDKTEMVKVTLDKPL